MTLADQMQNDVSGVFLDTEEHAETATYTPSGGVGASIIIVVSDEDSMDPQMYEDGKQRIAKLVFYCAVADVPTVTVHEDTVTARGNTYTVKAIPEKDQWLQRLEAETAIPMRKSSQRYERNR